MNPQDKQPNQPLNQAVPNPNPASTPNPPQPLDQSIHVNQTSDPTIGRLDYQPTYTPSQQPETQNAVMGKKRRFYARFSFWIRLIVIVICVWLAYIYLAPSNLKSSINEQIVKVASPLTTAGWKTYSDNNMINASFKYPSDWKMTRQVSEYWSITITSPDYKQSKVWQAKDWEWGAVAGSTIDIESMDGTKDTPLDKVAEVLSGPVIKYENISIDGTKAFEYSPSNGFADTRKIVLFYNNGKY